MSKLIISLKKPINNREQEPITAYALLVVLDRLKVIKIKSSYGHFAPVGSKSYMDQPLFDREQGHANSLIVNIY